MGLYFRGNKLVSYNKVFLLLSPYHLKKYFVDSSSSKMSRLSILMFKFITFAFLKKKKTTKKSSRKTWFSIISTYSSPAWCLLQILTSGNRGSLHSHVWQLPETNFLDLLFCNNELPSIFLAISYPAYSRQVPRFPGAIAATQTAQFPSWGTQALLSLATLRAPAFLTPLLTLSS